MDSRSVTKVLRSGRKIDGWFQPGAAQLFGLLDEIQAEAGITGNLFEIGVHHGKSAVLLSHMRRGTETVQVCDVFGDQGLNESGSGHGDRAIFERHYAAVGAGDTPAVFQKMSYDLTAEEIGPGVRFFHVDGGHLAEEAMADIKLAAAVLDERGVIVVDDPYHPAWPGVTEAIIDFLREREDYAPIALGFNKMLLAPVAARDTYMSGLARLEWRYFDRHVYLRKDLPIAGQQAAIYFVPASRSVSPSLTPLIAKTRWATGGVRKRLPI